MKVAKKLVLVVLFVMAYSITVWGAGSFYNGNDYTAEQYFYGTPGHRGEEVKGKMHFNRDGHPQAFFREGEKKQVTYTWIGLDLYKNGVFQEECWYYFGQSNYVTERWIKVDEKWYYTRIRGVDDGWVKSDGNYYYLDPVERYMWTSGEVERDGQMYIIGSGGIARPKSELGYSGDVVSGGGNTGWATEDNKWYYLRDGVRVKNEWLQDGEARYYMGSDGYISKGPQKVDGTAYYFDYTSGKMLTNLTSYCDKQKYWFGEDGKGVPLEMTTVEKIRKSDVVAWMDATYAIYTEEVNAAIFMGARSGPEVTKELLVQDWGISGAEDGWNKIDALVSSASGTSDKVTKAWDYSRAMLLCGALRDAGYITLEEKVEKQFSIAPSIQASFSSWDDFNDNYMAGYARWANATGNGDNVLRRQKWYEYLNEQPSGPFTQEWGMELNKDW